MEFSTFDVEPKRKRITVFKVGKLWLFKYFFEDKEVFKALLDYYNKDLYRFELRSLGERNKVLKFLGRVCELLKSANKRPNGDSPGNRPVASDLGNDFQ